MQYNINSKKSKKYELISRVYQRRQDAEKVIKDFSVEVPFKPYIKQNKSKTGYYVCFLASWYKTRLLEWKDFLFLRGCKCYLVVA